MLIIVNEDFILIININQQKVESFIKVCKLIINYMQVLVDILVFKK